MGGWVATEGAGAAAARLIEHSRPWSDTGSPAAADAAAASTGGGAEAEQRKRLQSWAVARWLLDRINARLGMLRGDAARRHAVHMQDTAAVAVQGSVGVGVGGGGGISPITQMVEHELLIAAVTHVAQEHARSPVTAQTALEDLRRQGSSDDGDDGDDSGGDGDGGGGSRSRASEAEGAPAARRRQWPPIDTPESAEGAAPGSLLWVAERSQLPAPMLGLVGHSLVSDAVLDTSAGPVAAAMRQLLYCCSPVGQPRGID
eukprot:COSAG01_NODE_3919_length_5537_cov_3.626333_2_plen_259_part_00